MTSNYPGSCSECKGGTFRQSGSSFDSKCVEHQNCPAGKYIINPTKTQQGTCENCPKGT